MGCRPRNRRLASRTSSVALGSRQAATGGSDARLHRGVAQLSACPPGAPCAERLEAPWTLSSWDRPTGANATAALAAIVARCKVLVANLVAALGRRSARSVRL